MMRDRMTKLTLVAEGRTEFHARRPMTCADKNAMQAPCLLIWLIC